MGSAGGAGVAVLIPVRLADHHPAASAVNGSCPLADVVGQGGCFTATALLRAPSEVGASNLPFSRCS